MKESQVAAMDEFIDNIKILINALGYKVLEPLTNIQTKSDGSDADNILYLNVGFEAIKRNMIRGNITRGKGRHHKEKTDFEGAHYVECFLIRKNVCVAKDRIDVPIGDI